MARAGIWWEIVALGLLAGCAHHQKPEFVSPVPITEPSPPDGAATGLTVPKPGPDGTFETVNSGIDAEEAIWHLRAALNVAALSCRNDTTIVASYNRLLTDRKSMLAAAYAAESGRFGPNEQAALDQHMTRLYNFFALPPAQTAFCQVASAEAKRATNVPSAGFQAYAKDALNRLESPILAFYRAYDAYSRDLAEWRAHPHPTPEIAAAEPSARITIPAGTATNGVEKTKDNWRIQIGAFTGRDAAKGAWLRAKTRVPGLARYKPHYEAVPDRPELVRLQLGSAEDRAGALDLCATAAAGGFDCLPVAR